MQHNLLSEYLQDVRLAVQSLMNVYVEYYEEEVLTSYRVNVRIRIRFAQGHLLALHEAIALQAGRLVWLSYRYHFQNQQNALIFRYDDTPLFPKLPTFPHHNHKHIPQSVIAASKPPIIDAITEAKSKGAPNEY